MLRVLRPQGRLVIAVWDALERAPGYLALTELLRVLFGTNVAGAMHAPFALGDRQELLRLLGGAGAAGVQVKTQTGIVSFASADAMISTEGACVWTLGGLLDEQQLAQLRQQARGVLQPSSAVMAAFNSIVRRTSFPRQRPEVRTTAATSR